MRFVKMHGLGNDYVYINGFHETVADPAALAPVISDRHTGVGSDGLILVLPPERDAADDGAHIRMRMFNRDGSEGDMCGNGIRCVCKLAHDHGLCGANPMRVQTKSGVLSLDYELDDADRVSRVSVDMGVPSFDPARVPLDLQHVRRTDQPHVVTLELDASGERFTVTAVSMGNPHGVIFLPEVASVDLPRLGPLLERHPAFPARANIHFVRVDARDRLTMRTWERGSGITMACGTGASAVLAAAAATDRAERHAEVHLPGGTLDILWRDDDHIVMTGPAVEVFTGDWPDA